MCIYGKKLIYTGQNLRNKIRGNQELNDFIYTLTLHTLTRTLKGAFRINRVV